MLSIDSIAKIAAEKVGEAPRLWMVEFEELSASDRLEVDKDVV